MGWGEGGWGLPPISTNFITLQSYPSYVPKGKELRYGCTVANIRKHTSYVIRGKRKERDGKEKKGKERNIQRN